MSPIIEESGSQVTTFVPFNHKDVMVKIRSIFQLLLAVYFMAFYFTKMHYFTSMLTNKLHLLGDFVTPKSPIRALPLDPAAGGLLSPRPPPMSPTTETDRRLS